MIHLCVNAHHDSSVTIVKDEVVIAHILEERFTHIKHKGPPMMALDQIENYIDSLNTISFTHLHHKYADFNHTVAFLQYISKVESPNMSNPEVHNDHHDLHAICGLFHSGFEDAVVVVIDGAGSTYSCGKENQTIYDCDQEKLHIIERDIVGSGEPVHDPFGNPIPDYVRKKTFIGAGYVYASITEACGFYALDCGKTMGLSAYGKEDCSIPKLLTVEDGGNKNFLLGGKPNLEYYGLTHAVLIKELIENSDKENLAYRVQKDYEEYLITTCKRALSKSKSKNLVLTGGCALNCVANYRLLKSLPEDINLYVEPVSDDSGVSIGGAIQQCNLRNTKLKTLYLGGQLSHSYKLEEGESEYDVEPEHVAKLISLGNIVAIAQGRSEIGPRALGNRSILFDPRVKDGRDIVNTVKKREYFRPFAGTVLKEHAKEWFDLDRLDESPFMMYAVDALSDKKDKIPAILHIDGTCRIQTVTSKQNKNYYDLISEFYKLTGVPILFNTSFNLAGDTMVETIDDAFRTIRNSDINYMYLPETKKLISVPYNLGKSTKPCYNL